jgi:hypothetical protein
MMRKELALLLALLAPLALAGEIYTWKDASGRVNYSDTPPPGAQQVRTLRQGTTEPQAAPAPAAATPQAKSIAEQEVEFRKRRAAAQEVEAKAEKEKVAMEEKQRNCQQAKNQLAALESGQRVARFNEQGEREFLEDNQRAAEIERARKAVADWCN